MHYMKRKTKAKDYWMALKLDMSKAYDQVEWNYQEAMLVQLGFDRRVIQLFMCCISSVHYKISHTGKLFGSRILEQGLRQRDPLSSYLLLVCTEGLTAFINDFERMKLIKGIKVARSALPISHIFFADDSYIFCKASTERADNVMELLKVFEKASGQKLNVDKSSAFFSKNVPGPLKFELCQKLGFSEANERSLYLGLPNIVGKNKSALFGYMKDKMQDHIQGWGKKLLSKGGNKILLQTVAQTLLNYAMNVFQLPLDLCEHLERLMCKFW